MFCIINTYMTFLAPDNDNTVFLAMFKEPFNFIRSDQSRRAHFSEHFIILRIDTLRDNFFSRNQSFTILETKPKMF